MNHYKQIAGMKIKLRKPFLLEYNRFFSRPHIHVGLRKEVLTIIYAVEESSNILHEKKRRGFKAVTVHVQKVQNH